MLSLNGFQFTFAPDENLDNEDFWETCLYFFLVVSHSLTYFLSDGQEEMEASKRAIISIPAAHGNVPERSAALPSSPKTSAHSLQQKRSRKKSKAKVASIDIPEEEVRFSFLQS